MLSTGGWLWLLLVVMMTMTWSSSWGQKVEKDGLGVDTYNMEGKENADNVAAEAKKDSKDELKYVVTEEVYFDIVITNSSKHEKPLRGRVTIGCFGTITPITCLNFIALAKGHRKGRKLMTYKKTPVHRVVKDFIVQMGDVTGSKGKSGTSIFGDSFEDENFKLSHRGAGWVSMANHGKDTNGSQFFIMLQPARWLDGKHVVFGKVLKGMDFIRKLGELETSVTSRPKIRVYIEDSGVNEIDKKYELSASKALSNDDIVS